MSERLTTAITEDLVVYRLEPEFLRWLKTVEPDGPRLTFRRRARTLFRFVRSMGYNPWSPFGWIRCWREQRANNTVLAADSAYAATLGIAYREGPDPEWLTADGGIVFNLRCLR